MTEPAAATPAASTAPAPATTTTSTAGPTSTTTTNSTAPNPTPNNSNANNNSNNTTSTSTSNPNPNQSADSSASSTANRGLPYYEKLRRELRDTLQKKRLMDKSMAQLEDQIYRFEQSYLEETTAGNIIKGFDNYIKGSSSGAGIGGAGIALSSSMSGGGGAARRKATVSDADRVFSRSSASFMRDSPAPSSAQTTPSHAATPNSTYNGSTGKPGNGDASSAANSVKGGQASKNKKKSAASNKDKGDDDGTDGDRPPTKRLKITYGRD
ncbi:histone acetyltransferase subunit NuA4-domain-containing protein [Aspergillus welwitschiae]|uniref:Chromatin modification-related protein EAF6 n=1 Tax=Aspergillus welwitschiae TaxID=1341132 RepID=A0A3F3PRK7_9EURO|nr:histone acetyltransferase subunit NuA4-domain-containing protein [Aspergillus welwitschiae]RDH29577.1 histone acetyltransferase subunit NuA4-domain-containing protein [Aspergillus welwitschiae]